MHPSASVLAARTARFHGCLKAFPREEQGWPKDTACISQVVAVCYANYLAFCGQVSSSLVVELFQPSAYTICSWSDLGSPKIKRSKEGINTEMHDGRRGKDVHLFGSLSKHTDTDTAGVWENHLN